MKSLHRGGTINQKSDLTTSTRPFDMRFIANGQTLALALESFIKSSNWRGQF